jgi:hypothetical protein
MSEQLDITDDDVRTIAAESANRLELWSRFLDHAGARVLAEVGVYRGDFAARVLDHCPAITRYYLVDPWRHLDDWNKPANKSDDVFEGYLRAVLDKTEKHAEKRIVLRGTTIEVSDEIADGELDFVYIDADHTLRGITTDLLRLYPKVREGGFVGGDDFCRSIFQHSVEFEPTLVFPYAVYFAEAMGARIYALPYRQFLIQKTSGSEHSFIDLTGRYNDITLKGQLASRLRPKKKAPAPAEAPKSTRTRRPIRAIAQRLSRR